MNKIKIKFGQIEFEVEGDSDLIERERQQFFSILPSAINSVAPALSSISQSGTNESDNELIEPTLIADTVDVDSCNIKLNESAKSYETLASLIRDKKFVNDTDVVMGVTYFLDIIKGYSSFNSNDIVQALSDARQPKLSNVNAFINSNVNKGFLLEESKKKEGKKAFRITAKGIDYVEAYVGSDKTNTTKSKNGSKGSKAISKYKDVTREELNIATYKSISEFSNFKDKMIYTMYIFMKECKGDYFSANDLSYIIPNIFGENASINQINGVFRRNVTFFNKINNDGNSVEYKLMNAGIKYVEGLVTE